MENCPFCSASISHTSKFCPSCGYKLAEEEIKQSEKSYQQRTYKLRSPMLESSGFQETSENKKFVFLLGVSKVFWFFAIVFFVFTVKNFVVSTDQDFFNKLFEACKLLLTGFLCLIIPSIISLLLNIEDHLSNLSKTHDKDKNKSVD